jgi:hypothetical protein
MMAFSRIETILRGICWPTVRIWPEASPWIQTPTPIARVTSPKGAAVGTASIVSNTWLLGWIRPGRNVRALAVALLLHIAALALPVASLEASGGGGSVVERDFPCVLSEGDGSLTLGMTGKVQVLTPVGVNHIICVDTAVTPTEHSAVIYDHDSTGDLFGILLPDDSWDITSRWLNVVTPSGVSVQFAHSEPGASGSPASSGRPVK